MGTPSIEGALHAFLRALPPAQRERAAAVPGLDRRLEALVQAGRAAWPGLTLEPEAFLIHLAERLPASRDLPEALEEVDVAGLYLACACLQGDPAAVAAFDLFYVQRIEAALCRFNPGLVAEVQQILRVRLLVVEDGGPPKLRQYSGLAELWGWIRVIAVRAALKIGDEERRQMASPQEELLEVPAPQDSPELAYLRKHYQEEFQEALAGAVQSLSSQQRTLLRHCYLDGLSIDQIGAIYRIHRSTAARRLTAARALLLARIHSLLKERLGASTSLVESIFRLVRSEIEVSLHDFFSTRSD